MKRVRILIGVACALLVLALLFPPFKHQFRGSTYHKGFAPIIDPPLIGTLAAEIDLPLLLAEWLLIGILTACAIALWGRARPESPQPPTPRDQCAEVPAIERPFIASPASPLGVQAWLRFSAALIDLGVLYVFMWGVGSVFRNSLPALPSAWILGAVVTSTMCLAFVCYHGGMLYLTGTTIGKAAAGLAVEGPGSSLPGAKAALVRSVRVLVAGYAVFLVFPLSFLLSAGFAYRELRAGRPTFWDAGAELQVRYVNTSPFRRLAVGVASICLISLLLIASLILEKAPSLHFASQTAAEQGRSQEPAEKEVCLEAYLDSDGQAVDLLGSNSPCQKGARRAINEGWTRAQLRRCLAAFNLHGGDIGEFLSNDAPCRRS